MLQSFARAFVLSLLCLVSCSQSTPPKADTPTPSPSVVTLRPSPTPEPGPPSTAGYRASGTVVVDGESHTVRSALAKWEQPHNLHILLSDTTVTEKIAADLKTLGEGDKREAWRKLSESGSANVWVVFSFPKEQPLREAKDVRFISFYALKDRATISAMPMKKVGKDLSAEDVVTIAEIDPKAPGTVKLTLKPMQFGGNCSAEFEVDCQVQERI